jgi:hypothetical protein
MIGDETNQAYPTNQSDAVMSRRSFVKSAAAAAVLGTASPQVLMAETKEPMPLRALGRTGEKVSAIGLGGYHIGKQADESESITIIVPIWPLIVSSAVPVSRVEDIVLRVRHFVEWAIHFSQA